MVSLSTPFWVVPLISILDRSSTICQVQSAINFIEEDIPQSVGLLPSFLFDDLNRTGRLFENRFGYRAMHEAAAVPVTHRAYYNHVRRPGVSALNNLLHHRSFQHLRLHSRLGMSLFEFLHRFFGKLLAAELHVLYIFFTFVGASFVAFFREGFYYRKN